MNARTNSFLIAVALLAMVDLQYAEASGWSATFGTAAGNEDVDAIYPTGDGGYLMTSDNTSHLTKVSAAGEVIWSRVMPGALLYPADGGFLVVSYRTLVKLNGLGEAVWWRTFDFPIHPTIARAFPDGTLLIGAVVENIPFIAKLTGNGQIVWQISVTLPGMAYLADLLPLGDGSFLASMLVYNLQDGEITSSADYVVRFSGRGAIVWARALAGMGQSSSGWMGVSKLGETEGGYFIFGNGFLILLDSTGSAKSFRTGLPFSDHGVWPTAGGGYIVAGTDYIVGAEVQKLDRQLNSEWLRGFDSGATSRLFSIAPTPAGGWIVGGAITPPGQSDPDGWIFRLASGGQPFGTCPDSVLAQRELGNGFRQCEVQLTYKSSPPYVPDVEVTRCDLPATPPGFTPARQDFDFACGPGELPNFVRCTVTTQNNYSGNFYVSSHSSAWSKIVGPNESVTFDLGFAFETPPGTYFVTATSGYGPNVISAPATVSTQPNPAFQSVQSPISWLPYNLSRNLLCSGEPEVCPFASALDGEPELDSDGDSLSDCIESNGVRDPETKEMLLDLPALDARPDRKDVFVEIDYVKVAGHRHRPEPQAIKLAEQAFAGIGINLHVDYGQWGVLSESDPIEGLLQICGDLKEADDILLHDEDRNHWCVMDDLKARQVTPRRLGFSIHRRGIFHYSVFGHQVDSRFSSGQSRGIPGAEFVIGLLGIGGVHEEAGTFIHELGHNLGLQHGGKDEVLNKPNYRSAMNYAFDSLLSFSKSALPPLNEMHLDEKAGIGTTDWTFYFCPPDVTSYPQYVADGSAIDWNCNSPDWKTPVERDMDADINGDGYHTLLNSFEDTKLIDYSGIRPAALALTGGTEKVSDPDPLELTVEQLIAIPKPVKLVIEPVLLVESLTWGETRQVVFRVANQGLEDDTYDLFAYSTAGYALAGAPGSLTLAPIALSGGESTLVEIALTALPAGVAEVSNLVLVGAGRRRPELADEASVQIVVGSSGPLSFYTLTPCRVADTRPASALASDLVRIFPVGSLCGVPPTAQAVAVNVTVAQPSGYGDVTLFPAGQALSATGTISFGPGQVRANNAILQLGSDAALAAVSFVKGGGDVHLIIDVTGYFE